MSPPGCGASVGGRVLVSMGMEVCLSICVLGRDWIQLAKQGEGSLASRMADMVRKAFN